MSVMHGSIRCLTRTITRTRPSVGAVRYARACGSQQGASSGHGGGCDHHHHNTKGSFIDLSDIFDQNENWIEESTKKDPEFFKRLGAGHNPKYL